MSQIEQQPAAQNAVDPAEQTEQTAQAEQTEQTQPTEPAASGSTQVQEADLLEVEEARQGPGGGQIDILLDSPMSVSVCLGNARPAVRELLEMGPGSVLRLDRQVGEPIDLYLRGIRFATGHLVVVDDHLGVRINEILATGQDSQGADGGFRGFRGQIPK
jgi:flagellar motor switch protein FliN/FliY